MAGPHAGNRNRPAYSGQARFRFPKQIIELFVPRPPLEFKPPRKRRRLPPMTGVAAYVKKFRSLPPVETKKSEEAKNEKMQTTDEEDKKPTSEVPFETPARRRSKKRSKLVAARKERIAEAVHKWDPLADTENKTRDARRTLFVHGFARDTPVARLRAEFETYGRVAQVIAPKDKQGVPRGYAFIEFERDAGLSAAYNEARGHKIDGRRIVVDVERARTTDGWKPNRLDGPNASLPRRSISSRPHSHRR